MSKTAAEKRAVRFSWHRDDFESRIGIRPAPFTRVSTILCFIVAAILAVAFYAALTLVPESKCAELFTKRGPFQYVAVLIAFWALVTLLMKW